MGEITIRPPQAAASNLSMANCYFAKPHGMQHCYIPFFMLLIPNGLLVLARHTMSLERANYQHLCLANCYEGPFLPLIALRECDEFDFRNASVAGIRSDR
jgi:hypothetical protein